MDVKELLEKELCPKCGTEMVEKDEPLRVRGVYVGSYNAMSCPICTYYYFTEKDYDLALSDARALGLVGPSLPEVNLKIIHEELDFGILQRTATSTIPTFEAQNNTELVLRRQHQILALERFITR